MTAALSEQWRQAGESIVEALRQHAEGIGAARARLVDQQTQLGALNISINAARAEVLERANRLEARFDILDEKLDSIAAVLAALAAKGAGHG